MGIDVPSEPDSDPSSDQDADDVPDTVLPGGDMKYYKRESIIGLKFWST
jgi:hypothetical protein